VSGQLNASDVTAK